MPSASHESSLELDKYLRRYSIENYDKFSCWKFTLYDSNTTSILFYVLLFSIPTLLAYHFLRFSIITVTVIILSLILFFISSFLRKFTYIVSDDRICMFVSHPIGEPVVYDGYSTKIEDGWSDESGASSFYSEVFFDNIDEVEDCDEELILYENKRVRENTFINNPPTKPSFEYTRRKVAVKNLTEEDLNQIHKRILASRI